MRTRYSGKTWNLYPSVCVIARMKFLYSAFFLFTRRFSWLSCPLILAAFLVCVAGDAQSIPPPTNSYHVQFVSNSEVRVFAQLLVRTGIIVMEGGVKPDSRSANVADLQVTSTNGEPLAATYDSQQSRWILPLSDPQLVNISYVVHLDSLRTLATWVHLQYGYLR
jgi:hypothetical protein